MKELDLTASRSTSSLSAKVFSVFLIGVTLGVLLLNFAWLWGLKPTGDASGHPVLLRFSSYLELETFLNRSGSSLPYYYLGRGQVVFAAAESKDAALDYSTTNIQVEGVDEADIVKSDGEYLYLSSNVRVLIVKAYPPGKAKVVSEFKLNGTVIGLFINGDRLVVFESEYQAFSVLRPEKMPFYREPVTHIRIYDVKDKEKPVLVRTVSSNGSYFTSRMIGDYVYVVVSKPAYLRDGEVILPAVIDNGEVEVVQPSEISYANVTDYNYGFTIIIAVNVRDDEAKPTRETFLLGASRGVYVSQSNIYLAIPRYDHEKGAEKTEVHRFRIDRSTIKPEASGDVLGFILNQFSMDEFQGYFRIATTTGHLARNRDQATSSNHVFVLNRDLAVVGRLEDLAPGESIYSARFMGKRCYLVTFKKVDPLFAISLEDPQKPAVLGKLKIPGYSNYLHPYDDNLLIGIGKETLEAEEGDFAWYQGVKISLFDVTDVERPVEVSKYVIGDRGTESPVLYDHKALLFDKKRNLLAIPVLVAEIDESRYPKGVPANAYGDYVWQGVYVFNVNATSITLRGGVSHASKADLIKSGYYFYSEYSVERSLYIGDFLYSISDKKIKINNLADLQQIGEIELP